MLYAEGQDGSASALVCLVRGTINCICTSCASYAAGNELTFGGTTLMSVIPPEGLTRRIFGPGTGPNESERPVRFVLPDFEAKRLVLDPFGTKFDAFGASRNFGRDLTSPVPALYYSRRGCLFF